MQHIRAIFKRGSAWIRHLNSGVNVSLSASTQNLSEYPPIVLFLQQTLPKITFYDFPDEDFCLFASFPHQQLVVPILEPGDQISCSCTVLFLVQHFRLYSSFLGNLSAGDQYESFGSYYSVVELSTSDPKLVLFQKCLGETERAAKAIEKCDFARRSLACSVVGLNMNEELGREVYFGLYDLIPLGDLLKVIFSLLVFPLMCLLGFLVNALSALVINRGDNKLRERMYLYLKLSCYFNCAYCVIAPLKLLSTCVNDLFCPSFQKSVGGQYFQIIVVKILGDSFR